jgi:hypothetical protein
MTFLAIFNFWKSRFIRPTLRIRLVNIPQTSSRWEFAK